jgi:HTH-type transcriptional regulator, transcriptional repressor of NAD biosynthesis genes
MRRGLVVGKFMPLHRGHQLLIETALANVDELTVVVYNTEIEDWDRRMPAGKRAGWIASLYPNIHNIVVNPDTLEGDHRTHDGPEYAQHYADQLAFLGPFTHVFSSENYGIPFANALGAEHVSVDDARSLVPISGTMLRDNLYQYRAFVDPLVYRSLIQKVVFVGTESTGKSTISKALAERYDTLHTQEFGRTLWGEYAKQGITPTFHDLWTVGRTQYEQEQASALHSNEYLFCDTNAWTTMLWSEMYYGVADQRLKDLAWAIKDEYQWFVCLNDFDWVDDGTRELNGNKSFDFQTYNMKRLQDFGIDFKILSGSLEQRISQFHTSVAALSHAS